MTELNDFEFEQFEPPEPARPQSRASWVWIPLLALLVAVASFLAVRWWRQPPAPQPGTQVETEEPVSGRSLGAPAAALDLPPLANSDAFVRKLVAGLSSHPRLAAWLVPGNLVDRFVAAVDNIADGKRPVTHLRPLAPTGSFVVSAGRTTIDLRSYERYDVVADVASSIDAHGAAQLYTILKPLIDEGYRQLGYPDRRFDDTLARAIRRLLDTPVPRDVVLVTPLEANYSYADPDLESRSPIEKQLMRMGPRNVRLIQQKLREVARELGL